MVPPSRERVRLFRAAPGQPPGLPSPGHATMAAVRALLLPLLLALSAPAQSPQPALAPLAFLLGSWEAEPQPGGGTGTCSFRVDLQGQAIVRTNHADVPASEGRPAASHDDLMVVFVEASQPLQADYFDNEGHRIRYAVTAGPDGKVAFLSAAAPGAPRFRLTYSPAPRGRVSGLFEIAAPGSEFRTYLSWTMRRPGSVPATP